MGSLLVLGGRYRMLKQYITLCSLSKEQKNEEIQQSIGTVWLKPRMKQITTSFILVKLRKNNESRRANPIYIVKAEKTEE
jgi:predicted neuraminidase